MGKVIITNDEVWAWNGSLLKPNPEHFEQGHTTGATGKKPRHDQFNYLERRRDLNLQYLLRMAGLPYDPLEVYPINARASKNGHMYISMENNNTGNDPISSSKWKHEDDDKFPLGTVIFNASDNRNPSLYKGFGVWEKVESETTINFSENDLGTVKGKNEVAVPLLDHNHTVTVDSTDIGNKNTSSYDHAHNETVPYGVSGSTSGTIAYYRISGVQGNHTVTTTDDIHSHSVHIGPHAHDASCSNTGINDASINVQGKRINILGWIRTG